MDLTAIYTSTAYKAGIDQEQALYVDDPLDHDGYPYVGVFVVREEDTENNYIKSVKVSGVDCTENKCVITMA